MSNDSKAPFGTDTWQPEYISQNLAEQSGYLEAVSASSVVQQIAANSMQLLALETGQRVLEVGCGSGVFLPRLAEAVGPDGRVVGIDHAQAFVDEGRSKMAALGLSDHVSLQQGDVYHLPFGDGSFEAAHCERVLMHLENPTEALRETARVVRPGGTIVAAEPDWAGCRIDHPDREAFDLLFAAALAIRQKDMGLTLYRRMGEVGLSNLRYLPVCAVINDFAMWGFFGLNLAPAVDALISASVLPAERLRNVLPALEEASAKGRFYSVAVIHVVAGTVGT